MSIHLQWPIFQGLMCSIANLWLYTSTWTYGKQRRHVKIVPGKIWILFWTTKTIWKNKIMLFVCIHGCVPLLRRWNWGQFSSPISQIRLNKETPLIQFDALLEIGIVLKKEPDRCTLRGVIAKNRFRTKCSWRRITPRSELKLNI